MTVLSRLTKRALTPAQIWGSDLNNWTSGNTNAGINVSPESAMRLSAVFACVRLLSNTISTLPVQVYRKVGDTRVPQADPDWLRSPTTNPNDTSVQHFAEVITSLLIDGNAFIRCIPSVFDPQYVFVIDPRRVWINPIDGIYRVTPATTLWSPEGGQYTSADIIHIPLITMPGKTRGMSPIDADREGIGLGLAADEFGSRFFSNGATLSGVITVPGPRPPDEVVNKIRDSFNMRHVSLRNSHAVGMLTNGATFNPISISPQDAQLLELRKYQVEDIARLFGVPPHMIGSQMPGAVSYASVEQRALEFVQSGVQPLVVRIEAAYRRMLGPDDYIKFNLAGLLRGDSPARAVTYATFLQNKVVTIDEIRALEDMQPADDAKGIDTLHGGFLQTPNNNAGPTADPGAQPPSNPGSLLP